MIPVQGIVLKLPRPVRSECPMNKLSPASPSAAIPCAEPATRRALRNVATQPTKKASAAVATINRRKRSSHAGLVCTNVNIKKMPSTRSRNAVKISSASGATRCLCIAQDTATATQMGREIACSLNRGTANSQRVSYAHEQRTFFFFRCPSRAGQHYRELSRTGGRWHAADGKWPSLGAGSDCHHEPRHRAR